MLLTRLIAVACLVLAVTRGATATDQPKPELADVLAQTADYYRTYTHATSGVLLDEQYQVIDTTSGRMGAISRISSDVVLVGVNGLIAALRDPYAIDTRPLREKEPRIMRLLAAPATPSLADWQRASSFPQEGAVHFMLDIIVKTNEPTLALQFGSAVFQDGLKYKLGGWKTMNDTRVIGLEFEEPEAQYKEYVLKTRSNARAKGRLWVDPLTGAVHQSELWVDSKREQANISVKFIRDAALGVLLPASMTANYDEREGGGGPRAIGSQDPRGSVMSRVSAETRAAYSSPTFARIDLTRLR